MEQAPRGCEVLGQLWENSYLNISSGSFDRVVKPGLLRGGGVRQFRVVFVPELILDQVWMILKCQKAFKIVV